MDRRLRQLRDHEPEPEALRPGDHQLTAPFSLSTFAHGQFAVVGSVTGSRVRRPVREHHVHDTMGLYILLIVLAVGFLLAVGAFIGRRGDEQTTRYLLRRISRMRRPLS